MKSKSNTSKQITSKHNNQYLKYPLQSGKQLKQQNSQSEINKTERFNHVDFHDQYLNPEKMSNNTQFIHNNHIKQQQKLSHYSQFTPFQALSHFKSTQEQYEMIKKRVQVLQLKDQKNNHKLSLNQRKLVLHNSIQKMAQLQKQKLNQWRYQNRQKLEQQKVLNLQQKLIRHRNLQQVSQRIAQHRSRQYQQRKHELQTNLQKIKQISQQSLQISKQKVQKIKNLEQLTRLSIQSYNRQKHLQFKEKKHRENRYLKSKKQKREQEIRKLMQLQIQMIEKQSRSRLIVDKSSQKLKKLLNPQTGLKSMSNSKILKKTSRGLENESNQISSMQQMNEMTGKLKSNDERHNENEKSHEYEEKNEQVNLFRQQSKYKEFSLPQIKNKKKFF